METEKYKIRYFDKDSKTVKDKTFEGPEAFEQAVKWGKQTLENFNTDLIQKIY